MNLISYSFLAKSLKQIHTVPYATIVFCFFAKIFSMATSFRMTSFASREAMTTAEPPEPFVSFAINILFHH